LAYTLPHTLNVYEIERPLYTQLFDATDLIVNKKGNTLAGKEEEEDVSGPLPLSLSPE